MHFFKLNSQTLNITLNIVLRETNTVQSVGSLSNRIFIDVNTLMNTRLNYSTQELDGGYIEFLGFSRIDGIPMFRSTYDIYPFLHYLGYTENQIEKIHMLEDYRDRLFPPQAPKAFEISVKGEVLIDGKVELNPLKIGRFILQQAEKKQSYNDVKNFFSID